MAEGGLGARPKSGTQREPPTEELVHDPSATAPVHSASGYAFHILAGGSNAPKDSKRDGAEKDKEWFQNVFITKFGMEWENKGTDTIFEPTATDFDHLIKVEKTHPGAGTSKDNAEQTSCTCICCKINALDFSNTDKVVLFISSHGEEQGEPVMSMSDDTKIRRSDIIKGLGDERCPGLKGKVRVVMICCCRDDEQKPEGYQYDSGKPVNVNDSGRNEQGIENLRIVDEDPVLWHEYRKDGRVLEIPPDFIFVQSAPSGRASIRNEKQGTWMMKGLNDTANNYNVGDTVNFMRMLSLANKRVCEKETKAYKKTYDAEGNVTGYEKDKNNKLIPDPILFGLKNTMCIEHRLTRGVYFKIKTPDLLNPVEIHQ